MQNMATSTFPDRLGNQSLAVLYSSVVLFIFLATPLVDALGTRLVLIFGGACYVAYELTLIRIVREVVLAFSVLNGIGGGMLWVALGIWIAQNSGPDEYPQHMGIFWSIFQVCVSNV